MTEKKPLHEDISALASEAFDLWQEHLALASNDTTAKAEMMRLLEPTRRLFADWAGMMQNAGDAPSAKSEPKPAPRSASSQPARDDRDILILQLADRMAGLEKRLARLEARKLVKAPKNIRSSSGRRSRV